MCLSPHKDTGIVTILIIGKIIITTTTSHFLAWNHSTIGEALSPDPIGVLSANWTTTTMDYKVTKIFNFPPALPAIVKKGCICIQPITFPKTVVKITTSSHKIIINGNRDTKTNLYYDNNCWISNSPK